MNFTGELELSVPPADAWQKLSDVRFLAPAIPDAGEITDCQEDRAKFKVRPGFAFVRGMLDMNLERLDMRPENSVGYRMISKGVGSISEVECNLNLNANGDGTRLSWTADVTRLTGLLKAVPQGLIRGAAHKVIDDVLASVKKKIEEG